MNGRAVTPMMGVLLMVGLTVVVAVGMFVVGSSMLGERQADAETSQVESSMSELAEDADRLAQGEVDQAEYEVEAGETSDIEVDGDAGSYEVRVERSDGSEVLTEGPLGVYRYTDDEGRRVAYQGGGVWRKDPSGTARRVTPPPFHYRSQPEPTLTLPVVRVANSSAASPERGSLVVSERRDVYPVQPDHTNPLQEGVVYVAVESEYCRAWEAFFAGRTDGSIDESCSESRDSVEGEVVVKLTVPLRIEGVDHGIWAEDAYIHKNADVERVKEGDYDAASVDILVQQREAECEDQGFEELSPEINESGLHCTHYIADDVNVSTDEAGGDVEIYTRNGSAKTSDITVNGDNGTVSVYVDDDMEYGGGGNRYTTIGNSNDPSQTMVFLNSSADFNQTGKGNVYGLIYAPRSTFWIQSQGKGEFLGAIVAQKVHVGSGSIKLRYNDEFTDVIVQEDGAGEPFYYLHVSETTLELEE